ncbi:CBM35 domain-containing protein [Streptomyces sp. NBC_01198]|uniref:CBM35 domain-containing protein n=1 Tax=Streptomyces sp. NBC_01198 TaxID=2903769 RepID=UPI002E0E379C|nr:glycosyl hydrolase family 18 protein [Streptomyces sp. NBC_01198]
MRWSRLAKVLGASALPTAAVAMSINATASASPQATNGFPAHYAAPYLELSSGTAGDMAADMKATGLKDYTLAFLIPKSVCTPQWEAGNSALGAFTSQVGSLKAAGGDVIISFGGAEGGELAQTCTAVSSLTAAYASVVNTYGITRLDFDIEGDTLGDSAANARRNQALAALQAQNPDVQVDYTLAVDPSGLESDTLNLLKDAKSKGVNVNLVNIMTMDFGDGENALNDALSAAKSTAAQLASLYGISTSQAYGRLGLTPIAGRNDDNENFTQANATTLEAFAATNGVQELSFWEVDSYDKATGYAYSQIFDKITGGTTPPPTSPPPSTPPPGGGNVSYEAEAATLAGGTTITSCAHCSGGKKLSYLGNGGTATFSTVSEPAAGSYTMSISFMSVGQARTAVVSVNGVNQTVSFPETPDYNTVVTKNVTIQLKAGNNTIKFSNPSAGAPNLDRIVV